MIYTEEDLKQAYSLGYNEAVDDVNAYIEQDSMEFSLDESCDDGYSAVEDMVTNESAKTSYSAVEDVIMNETKRWRKEEHEKAIHKFGRRYINNQLKDRNYTGTPQELKHHNAIDKAVTKQSETEYDNSFTRRNKPTSIPHLKVTAE